MNHRIKQLDLIRVIAVGFVVLCHATEKIYQFSVDSMVKRSMLDALAGLSFFTIGRLGVPLFLMLSGYLLLNRSYDERDCIRFWKNHVFRLFLCTTFWFLVYDVYLVLTGAESFSVFNIVKDILFLRQVGLGHTWYMPMVLGMYILIPYVANGLQSLKRSMLLLPCAIYIFYAFGSVYFNRANKLLLGEGLTVPFSLGFSGGCYGIYFILGYAKGFLNRFPARTLVVAFCCCFCMVVAEQYLGIRGGGYHLLVWYDDALLLVCSVCLFELFSRLRTVKAYPVIFNASNYSFAVYLIHMLILRLIAPYIDHFAVEDWVKVCILGGIVFLCSYVMAYIIRLVPRIGKLILYIK